MPEFRIDKNRTFPWLVIDGLSNDADQILPGTEYYRLIANSLIYANHSTILWRTWNRTVPASG